MVMSMVVE